MSAGTAAILPPDPTTCRPHPLHDGTRVLRETDGGVDGIVRALDSLTPARMAVTR